MLTFPGFVFGFPKIAFLKFLNKPVARVPTKQSHVLSHTAPLEVQQCCSFLILCSHNGVPFSAWMRLSVCLCIFVPHPPPQDFFTQSVMKRGCLVGEDGK